MPTFIADKSNRWRHGNLPCLRVRDLSFLRRGFSLDVVTDHNHVWDLSQPNPPLSAPIGQSRRSTKVLGAPIVCTHDDRPETEFQAHNEGVSWVGIEEYAARFGSYTPTCFTQYIADGALAQKCHQLVSQGWT